jgi:murein DD-endopeptidase MepM/ murein hydrolase activator NlpD
VKAGDYVYPGKTIGYAGTTGSSSGVHLHFEIIRVDCYLNPLLILD